MVCDIMAFFNCKNKYRKIESDKKMNDANILNYIPRQIRSLSFIISKLEKKSIAQYTVLATHVNLVHILTINYKNWVIKTVPQVMQLQVSDQGSAQEFNPVSILFQPHHSFPFAYSAVWFQTDLASYSPGTFNAMTDLNNHCLAKLHAEPDNCFLKFSFPGGFLTALLWNSG